MRILLAIAAIGAAFAQTPGVGDVMARVAENQDRALALRKEYVYHQRQLLRMVRGNGKVAREERREYAVTPGESKILKELTHFEGRYQHKGGYVSYDKPGYEYKGLDIDGNLIDDMSNDLTNDENSVDGIGHSLFPLTGKEQAKYTFRLLGTESFQGRKAYRVAFEPSPEHLSLEEGGAFWKGEALIDAGEHQPIQVNTKMAPKIPMAVKILLGTNLKGLGFSVSFRKFGDGVWFPVSYGGEFEVRALFFYKRTISISMANTDFRRTDVNSRLAYATEDQ
jgi:hypothetical protein